MMYIVVEIYAQFFPEAAAQLRAIALFVAVFHVRPSACCEAHRYVTRHSSRLTHTFRFCGSISALALSFLAMNTYVAIVTTCMAAAAAYNESR
jgi:hypothetical protein